MISENIVFHNNLSATLCHNPRESERRFVVAYYGAHMNKRVMSKLAYIRRLVENGFSVIIPELYKHGERMEPQPYNPQKDRLEVAVRAANEIYPLLHYFLHDNERCQVIGGSLGGLCAFAAAVQEPRIKTIPTGCATR